MPELVSTAVKRVICQESVKIREKQAVILDSALIAAKVGTCQENVQNQDKVAEAAEEADVKPLEIIVPVSTVAKKVTCLETVRK